jgi:hypothetical protein
LDAWKTPKTASEVTASIAKRPTSGTSVGPATTRPFRSEASWAARSATRSALIVGESVSATHATSIDKTVQQIGPATKGAVHAGVEGRRPDPPPSPGPGEVTFSEAGPEQVKDECRCDDCVGCAWTWTRGSFIQRGRILVSTGSGASTAAHELGHVIGLAHIISPTGVRPPFTMGFTPDGKYSPVGQLDVLEPATVRMLETLYGAGLTAGSTRRQLEAAGFVPPEAGSAAAIAESARRARADVVGRDGDETIVIERIPGAHSRSGEGFAAGSSSTLMGQPGSSPWTRTRKPGRVGHRTFARSRRTIDEGLPTGLQEPVNSRAPVLRFTRKTATLSARWLQQ